MKFPKHVRVLYTSTPLNKLGVLFFVCLFWPGMLISLHLSSKYMSPFYFSSLISSATSSVKPPLIVLFSSASATILHLRLRSYCHYGICSAAILLWY